MLSVNTEVTLGQAWVQATSGRGFTPEELADRAVAKIVSISDAADPAIQAQAHAFKGKVHAVVLHYMKQAVLSEHTTLLNKFIAAGKPELAAFLGE